MARKSTSNMKPANPSLRRGGTRYKSTVPAKRRRSADNEDVIRADEVSSDEEFRAEGEAAESGSIYDGTDKSFASGLGADTTNPVHLNTPQTDSDYDDHEENATKTRQSVSSDRDGSVNNGGDQASTSTLSNATVPRQNSAVVDDLKDQPSQIPTESPSKPTTPTAAPIDDASNSPTAEQSSEPHYTIISHEPGSTVLRIVATDKLEEKIKKLEEKLAATEDSFNQMRGMYGRARILMESTERDNQVLRTHNVSFARENAQHRAQHTEIYNMRLAILNAHAIDEQTGLVRTMESVLAENNHVKEQWQIERNTVATMAQCCREWVKLEATWRTEQAVLENHLRNMEAAENDHARDRAGLVERIRELEGHQRECERTIADLEMQLYQRVPRAPVSQYPEL